VTFGAKADNRNAATDTTAITAMAVLKQISYMLQNLVLSAGSAVIGKFGIDQTTPGTTNAVQIIPGVSGGWTPYHLISAASTNATNVKNSAGQVGPIAVGNVNASPRYLKLYDKASAPTVGSDTPVWTMIIPGNTAGAGSNISVVCGLVFANGISYALTAGMADNDTGAVGVADICLNLGYK
jgi:hypothetical protein